MNRAALLLLAAACSSAPGGGGGPHDAANYDSAPPAGDAGGTADARAGTDAPPGTPDASHSPDSMSHMPTWTNLTPAPPLPSAWPAGRALPAGAYDSDAGRAYLFGGFFDDGTPISPNQHYLDDLRAWDGTQWLAFAKAGAWPTPRAGAAMTYDANRKRLVMFGGVTSTGKMLGDLWEWDGAQWFDRTLVDAPPARALSALVYDLSTKRVVLVGGLADARTALGDAWEWDGTKWTGLPDAPAPRCQHGLAYDNARGRVVLFGGFTPGDSSSGAIPLDYNDVFEWNGTKWSTPTTPATAPSPRHQVGFAYDGASVVLVGGLLADVTHPAELFYGDAWRWDGAAWTEIAAPLPPARAGALLVAQPSGVFLFAGRDGAQVPHFLSDLWSFAP